MQCHEIFVTKKVLNKLIYYYYFAFIVGDVVEVMTSVLDNEEDDEGHLTCLLITQDLLTKDSEGFFLEQFAKLGLFQKVHALSDGADLDGDSLHDGAEGGVIGEGREAGPKGKKYALKKYDQFTLKY